ncbi:type I-C CRISPR-associated protein Cas8c/Csd1 [uncultured Dialister sp.]|uniref:type I-C CRISPR-associated protein Cas8c/Csd1 n=1 Tax=uncultured Dialister sp. TaxID=278064 RepID=UPI0025D56798|nr:type I-C CRISPR-associated protein Cas8c/Csd1 [uncultured Dialister sp.]
MILQALVHLYEELKTQGEIESPGWGKSKVSHRLVIGNKGQLLGILSVRVKVARGKKEIEIPPEMSVPQPVKRSVGIAPNFLCDTNSYILGIDNKGKEDRTKRCFEASKQLHHEILDSCQSPAAKAVLAFFDNWIPEKAATNPIIAARLDDVYKASNFIFEYEGSDVIKDSEIQKAWERYRTEKDKSGTRPKGQCLVTGLENQPIAVLHPNLKGIRDAQSSGAALVSFNAPSFESYGHNKDQGLNAPVSEYAAFAYGAALNHLLADKKHVKVLGNTTIVFWAENAQPLYMDVFDSYANGEDCGISNEDIHRAVSNLVQGIPADLNENELNPEEPFYILGLAPNAARVAVRFFIRNSFGKAMKNVWNHQERMTIEGPPNRKPWIPFWQLLSETANHHSRDSAASPVMAGMLMKAVFNGQPYPETTYQNILLRIFSDHDEKNDNGTITYRKISYIKAGFIKAYLLKNHTTRWEGQLQMKVNENCKEIPYVLGRLFSVLESIQQEANPGISSTIKDRYFNAACATPAVTYPVLLKLANAHLKKIRNEAFRINDSKKLQSLLSLISMPDSGTPFPKRLSLEEQGAFILGYYQETQTRYSKKEEA